MARLHNFAVIRLAPDPLRGEALNVGVIIFRQGEVDIRLGEVLTRARAVYPAANSEILHDGVAVMRRLGAAPLPPSELHRTMQRIGLFALGELGSFTVDDDRPETYEGHVARLLKAFTGGRPVAERLKPVPRLTTAVRKVFRKEKLLAPAGDAGAILEHRIVPDWPIPNRPSLRADLALKNRIMRVCEVVDLKLDEDSPPPPALFEGVVTLDVAEREVDAKQRVLAYRAVGSARRIDEALAIARLHATNLVNWNSADERETFLHEWIDAARAGTASYQH
jgi:hypothetical protein